MENANTPAPIGGDESREPTIEDLVKLCRALNDNGARYLVVGGLAIRAAGFIRATMDVDLLIETGAENESRVFLGLMVLPDQAVRELKPGEISEYGVVRVADEIVVDLMKTACGVTYQDAARDVVYHEIEGVRIPFASPKTLWRMKQTVREKDIPDRLFLQKLLRPQGVRADATGSGTREKGLRSWFRRLLGKD